MKENFLNKAIVIGVDHHNTLGIIRSLGERGVKVHAIILNCKTAYISYSRYLKEVMYVDSDSDLLRDLLVQKYQNEEYKPVLIPSCDIAALLLEKIKSKLADLFVLGGCSTDGGVAFYMNKLNLGMLARDLGICVPPMIVFEIDKNTSLDDLLSKLKNQQIRFPIIMKPLMSAENSKSAIVVVQKEDDMHSDSTLLKHGRYLIQEYINIEQEYGLQGVSYADEEKVVIPAIVQKIRTSDVARGSTTYARLTNDISVIDVEKMKELVLSTGYSGIFDIELMQSGDKIYLVEINFRNGAYGYAYTKAGYNLPFEWYLHCIGRENDEVEKKHKQEITLISETADFNHVRRGKINIFSWLYQLLAANVKMLWNLKDPTPFFAKLLKKHR